MSVYGKVLVSQIKSMAIKMSKMNRDIRDHEKKAHHLFYNVIKLKTVQIQILKGHSCPTFEVDNYYLWLPQDHMESHIFPKSPQTL